jgi:hypothetical protein
MHPPKLLSSTPRKLLLSALFIVFAVAVAHAQNAPDTPLPPPAIQIIPQPKKLTPTGETFPLGGGVRVVLADNNSEDDRFAAQDFIDDVGATAGVALAPSKRTGRGGRGVILVGPVEHPQVRAELARAGLSLPESANAEGYLVSVSRDGAVVAGRTAAGIFYGMQTLKQLVRGAGATAHIQGARIADWPTMRWRGVSDDISRGPVPTVEYVKRQLRTMSFYKLNMHSFYMEHTFASASHPLIAPAGGSLTPAEIRELAAYARRLHIELVPQQQTFGHLHKALKLEKYNALSEVPYGDMLSPQQMDSYNLVADWYRELNELFPGQFFHIGADETFELGQGQSREAVRTRGVGTVYFEHLRRVRELLRPYNRRLMFWGDIALNHPELMSSVPRDMIVMNWDYEGRDSFAARIKPFKDAGLEQFVCPGVQNWNQIFPNLETADANIRNFVRDGQAAGASGMLNTQWDDDGESLFETTWYAVALGAAASWQDAPLDAVVFGRNFDWSHFRSDGERFTQAMRALGGVNKLLAVGSTHDLFWRGPFNASFIEERVRPLSERTKQMRLSVEEAAETLLRDGRHARRNRQTIDAMLFAAQRFDHMGRRMQLVEQFSRDYWDAYLHLGERRRVQRLRRYTSPIYNGLREMAEELSVLKQGYREQWLRENRPYWLDSILARYDLAVAVWLARSKALDEALREYNETSVLPSPDEFGLGARPAAEQEP